jgi:hypothetical protein
LCCFYNEKVDIEIDGVVMERPGVRGPPTGKAAGSA